MKYAILFCLCLPATSLFSQGTVSTFQKADSLFAAGRWKEAALAYQTGLKTAVSDGRAWYRLGAARQMAAQYPQAIEAYQKSLATPSSFIPPVFVKADLANAYARNKDSAKALDVLNDMVTGNGYGNFIDLDTASAYQWLKSNARFAAILSKATSNAYPCLNNPQNREFDFWIGEWDVFQTGTDFRVGKQRIEKASGGCAVLENWTATSVPGEGKSMNFISPKTGKWEQVWMGSGGLYLNYYNGEYKDGAMRYEGDGLDKAGKKVLFRLTYFNLGNESLRQLLERSGNGGKTWTIVYDFSYKRNK